MNRALDSAPEDAERLLLNRFDSVYLADLAAEFDAVCRSEGWGGQHTGHDDDSIAAR